MPAHIAAAAHQTHDASRVFRFLFYGISHGFCGAAFPTLSGNDAVQQIQAEIARVARDSSWRARTNFRLRWISVSASATLIPIASYVDAERASIYYLRYDSNRRLSRHRDQTNHARPIKRAPAMTASNLWNRLRKVGSLFHRLPSAKPI
jgi:hypothetical protein